MNVPGGGLARGLAVTLRTMTRRSATRQYPDVQPDLPPRSRGVIALFEENCTVCMLCARECPDWCIYIDSHKESMPAREEGARARQRNVVDRFAIDFALCMYWRHLHRGLPVRRAVLVAGVRVRGVRRPRADPREGPAARVDVDGAAAAGA